MIKVGIIGATGYTGIELLRLLLRHPQVQITLATSEKHAGKRIDNILPSFSGATDLVLEELNDDAITSKCDFAFSCLPHQSAMKHVAHWYAKGLKVVDLSADFRFASAETYAQWYEPHSKPELLSKAVYGLPELYRDQIKSAQLIGNPGCYPTGAILSLVPLLKAEAIIAESIIIDSKSGVSGAGRSASVDSLFSEVNDSFHAYKVGKHRHTPEIEKELTKAAGQSVVISFTPHLVPMDRGILTTMYAQSQPNGPKDTASVLKILHDAYKNEPFVKIMPEGILPKTKEVRGSNRCHIGAVYDPRTNRIVIIAAIDNLLKGASSQAVQNMNLMCGFEETMGLQALALLP
ncbi:MAG: N-acetyl-gamma-glutamyl-phosphate reductase [Deltaproteobacteria bacterium]|nr:MAG: N-acetyl-gamma-glutamyl-phosphate reductase [Deltaproteobacteria bacterium]